MHKGDLMHHRGVFLMHSQGSFLTDLMHSQGSFLDAFTGELSNRLDAFTGEFSGCQQSLDWTSGLD